MCISIDSNIRKRQIVHTLSLEKIAVWNMSRKLLKSRMLTSSSLQFSETDCKVQLYVFLGWGQFYTIFKNAFVHTLEKQIFVYSTVCIVLALILHSEAFDLVPDILWRLCMPCVNCSKCLSKGLYIFWVSFVVLGLSISAFLCVCALLTNVCFNLNCWS